MELLIVVGLLIYADHILKIALVSILYKGQIMSKEQIAELIKNLSTLDDETLIYYYKCSLSRGDSYKPLIRAIESERRARNKIKPIPEEEPDNDKVTSTDT